MKVLTLRQPWATIIAEGLKDIEVRTWSTRFRGPLIIHAGKGWDSAAWDEFKVKIPDLFKRREFFDKVQADKGRVIARTKLVTVKRYADPDSFLKDFERHFNAFTRYREGLFGWVLGRRYRLADPAEVKGRLGLWNYDGDTRVRVERST